MKTVKIFLWATLLFVSCKKANKPAEEPTEANTESNIVNLSGPQAAQAGITTVRLSSARMPHIEKVNGKIDVPPQNLVSISCPTGGYLTHTNLLPGMRVRKGEAIATISDRQFIQLQQDYLSTKAKIHFAELEYGRQKSLAENEATSDKALQLANAELQQNKILLATLVEQLKLAHINPASVSASNIRSSISLFSPINGFINKVNVNIGKYVSPSEVLFEIINPSDIHLNLKVFENVAQSLKIGQKLVCYSNTQPEKKYHCEILLINKEVDADGTVDVHCHFDNYDPTLIVGMYMNAEIETASQLQNALPSECITSFEGKNYVFVALKPNSYEMVEVQTGLEEANLTEIKSAGVIANKSIVQKGAYTLLMALKNKAE